MLQQQLVPPPMHSSAVQLSPLQICFCYANRHLLEFNPRKLVLLASKRIDLLWHVPSLDSEVCKTPFTWLIPMF